MFTRQSYWDAYCLYIDRCVKENWKNDIDPNHYRMEWNHYLPRSIFGDWPIGHWLTLRQHAIASALQSLAFDSNCMCAWHKEHLPAKLLELAWPIYCQACVVNGRRVHEEKNEEGKSIHAVSTAEKLNREKNEDGKSINAVKAGKKSMEKLHKEKNVEGKSLYALKLHEEKNKEGKSIHAVRCGKITGLKNQRGVQLIRVKDGEVFIFESIRFAAEMLKIRHQHISRVCLGERKTVGGYTATYWDG